MAGWTEFAIVSRVEPGAALAVGKAPGEKCARCWKVLPEVGTNPPTRSLCLRCVDAVESGLVGQPRIDAA